MKPPFLRVDGISGVPVLINVHDVMFVEVKAVSIAPQQIDSVTVINLRDPKSTQIAVRHSVDRVYDLLAEAWAGILG